MNGLSESEAYKVLQETDEGCVRWAHGNGFEWLRDTFLPAMTLAQDTFLNEEALIADCFYVLGDIHDFNDAPLAAIKAYTQAIRYDSEFAAAYREMALMYQCIGDYEEASRLIDIAVNLAPKEKNALSDQTFIKEVLVRKPEPFYKKSNIIWQCDELLANFAFEQAFSMLHNSVGVDYCRARARCYGALTDSPNYLKEWYQLSTLDLAFEMTYSDWFYMPEQIFDSPEIWRILLNVYEYIEPGVFVGYDSLYESDQYRNLEHKEKNKLLIEFNIYRTSNDIDGLSQLQKLYPNWEELNEIVSLLK